MSGNLDLKSSPVKVVTNEDILLLMIVSVLRKLLRTQNVSERNQKHFLCLGHKFCVSNKCCARGNICVRNIVSSFASPASRLSLGAASLIAACERPRIASR